MPPTLFIPLGVNKLIMPLATAELALIQSEPVEDKISEKDSLTTAF